MHELGPHSVSCTTDSRRSSRGGEAFSLVSQADQDNDDRGILGLV